MTIPCAWSLCLNLSILSGIFYVTQKCVYYASVMPYASTLYYAQNYMYGQYNLPRPSQIAFVLSCVWNGRPVWDCTWPFDSHKFTAELTNTLTPPPFHCIYFRTRFLLCNATPFSEMAWTYQHLLLQLVNAIARHTHPSSVQLLFAFDYTRALLNSKKEESMVGGAQDTPIPSYLNPRDWQRELHRLGVTNDQWKVTEVNKKFLVCNRCVQVWARICITTLSIFNYIHVM